EFMSKLIEPDTIISRIENFSDLMVIKDKFRPEMKHILIALFLRGKISKKEALRIANTSDKTFKISQDLLEKLDLIKIKKEGTSVFLYTNYSIPFSSIICPGLYPTDKDNGLLSTFL
ncbi:MAG: hypothetical protein ACPG44_09205, partial [Polaribacter sp.]